MSLHAVNVRHETPSIRTSMAVEACVTVAAFLSSTLIVWWRELRYLPSILETQDLKGYPGFYRAQAEAMLKGGFAVPAESLGDECYLIDGSCVGYFGLTPSVLRIPFLPIAQGDLSPVASLAGYLLNVAAALAILLLAWRYVARLGINTKRWDARALFVTMATGLGPGSLVLMVTYPDVGNEAILWGSGFILVQLVLVMLWVDGRSWIPLVLVLPIGVLAAISRPPMMISASAIALVVLVIAARRRASRVQLATAGLGVLLPAVAALGAFYAKFGEFLPDVRRNVFISSSPYWASIFEAIGGHFTGLMFVPTNLWNFLRPDAVAYNLTYPRGAFFTPIDYVWPMSEGMMYADPSASLTNLAPASLFLTFVLLVSVWVITSARVKSILVLVVSLSVSAGSGLVVTLGQLAMTNRYLVDAWPALTVGSVGGGLVVMYALTKRRSFGLPLLAATILLTLVGTGTTLVVMR